MMSTKDFPEKLSYEESKSLARDDDPTVRQALARHPDTKPEVLYFLAEDDDPAVRREIAENEHTPGQADLILAGDSDEDIRAALASKIARLTPSLAEGERGAVTDFTMEVVEKLAKDQVVRVRKIVSEALKDVAGAPTKVIQQLASDAELVVSGPVLRYSPVLTDADLLSIIRAGAAQGHLSAIAQRQDVAAGVVDVVAEKGDTKTVAALLSNKSAQIREETLDALVERAQGVPLWHAPLVERPLLSLRAARRLAGFVASDLLTRLQSRQDLPAETLEAVMHVVEERLEQKEVEDEDALVDPDWAMDDVSDEEIESLHAAGKLPLSTVVDAIEQGRRRYVEAALSVMATIPRDAVAKIVARRSPKAVVALAWKAGLEPAHSISLQVQLAGIPPDKMLVADDPDAWPMTDEDMDWQLEFFLGS